MNSADDIQGVEFDWYAIDRDGRAAILCTAGEGFVPTDVRADAARYNEISEGLQTPNLGSLAVWDDLAATGLYVYDWNLPGGPYKLVASPTRDLEPALLSRILALPGLPRLAIAFSACEALAASALVEST